MDIDEPEAPNGCSSELKVNGLLLHPVSPQDEGEGLPYAPINWPNPGDTWGWRVGKRTAISGYYLDRYLYLPSRLQKSRRGRDGFASKLSVEQYIQARLPGADVEAFFASFSWKIPSKQTFLVKEHNDSSCMLSEELAEASLSDCQNGGPACKAGSSLCPSLTEEEKVSSVSTTMFCDICCSEPSFCRECCCILCCKTIDFAFGGYSFIRCQAKANDGLICGHAAHLVCALRCYMAGTVPGMIALDAEYYCRRCDSRTELVEHVTKVFKICESVDSREDNKKMLNLVICLLRGSQRRDVKRLLNRAQLVLQKFESGNVSDIWILEDDISSVKKVPAPDEPTGFEKATAVLLALPESERSFKNFNFLLAEVKEMSTPTASVTKGKCSFLEVCIWLTFVIFLCLWCGVTLSASRGGRSSARLSGTSLLDQRRSAFKASSSAKGPSKTGASAGVVILDSPPSKVFGVKRKAMAAPDPSPGMLKERSAEDLTAFDDADAKKEIGDLHPIDCVNEAVVGAWKIFQYSRVASVAIQELSDQNDRKVARLEEMLKASESRTNSLERELSSVKQDRDARLEEARVKTEKLREEDGRIAADVGAYYCLRSRIEMMEEFAAGSHAEWKIDDARADMEMMYPDGNPGVELFKFAGLRVEEDKEEIAQDDAEEEVPQTDQEANSGKEVVHVEKSGES